MSDSVNASDCRKLGEKIGMPADVPKTKRVKKEQTTAKRFLIETHALLSKESFEIFRKCFIKLKTHKEDILANEILEAVLSAFFNSNIRHADLKTKF
jgi:hypothetical protein